MTGTTVDKNASDSPEKGPFTSDNASSNNDVEKGVVSDVGRKSSLPGRQSSVAESVVAAQLLDDRYNITQRGLKSRHAQMIALGGTIGSG
jgi:amino acid permease